MVASSSNFMSCYSHRLLLVQTAMAPLPSDDGDRRPSRHFRRPLLLAVATMLTIHPVNLPPIRLDFHVTVDTRPYDEAPPGHGPAMERR